MKKRNVNIIIRFDENHIPAIGALLASIVLLNKSRFSFYQIYIAASDIGLIPNVFSEENTEEYSIKLVDYDYFVGKKDEKFVILEWNTLVLRDLTGLFLTDIREEKVALVPDFPGDNELFPASVMNKYNMAVCVSRSPLGILRHEAVLEYSDVVELPVFYNMGYEEYINHIHKLEGLSANKWIKRCFNQKGIREKGYIIRLDAERSPEIYFDTPLSEMWLRYYKAGVTGNLPLRRISFVNSEGRITITPGEKYYPIFIRVTDADILNVKLLIYSIYFRLENGFKLDVRMLYKDLLPESKRALLMLENENISIALFQVREYLQNNECGFIKELAVSIFDEYPRIMILVPKMMACDSIHWFFEYSEENNLPEAEESTLPDYEEGNVIAWYSAQNGKESGDRIVIINSKEWLESDLGYEINQTYIKSKRKGNFENILQNVSHEKILMFPSEWTHQIRNQIPEQDFLFSEDAVLGENVVISYHKITDVLNHRGMISMIPDVYVAEMIEFQMNEEAGEDMNMDGQQWELFQKVSDMEAEIGELNRQIADLKKNNKKIQDELSARSDQADTYLYELTETRKSLSYRLAMMITALPRKIRSKK